MIENQNDFKEKINKLKEDTQNLEIEKIRRKNLCSDQQKAFQDRIYKIIDYAIGRHDWYDGQRHQFLQIGLALMAVGASLGAILVNFGKTWYISAYSLGLVILVVSSIFFSGLYQLYLYNHGIQRNYPYRQIADIRSWYFKYNFPSGLEDNLSNNFDIAYDQVNEVKDNIGKFFDRVLEYADDANKLLKEDLEQIFILLLLQRYRQQQVRVMSNALFNSMLLVAALLIITLFSFIILELPGADMNNISQQDAKDNGTFTEIYSQHFLNSCKEDISNGIQNSSIQIESPNRNKTSNIKSIGFYS